MAETILKTHLKKDFRVEGKEELNMEKGFSRLDELRRKIEDENYLQYAINRMANEICEVFFK
ncbi:MAG: hypothetical protein OEZ36_08775 [Spirochaetota bacterium]|nr:hypothetical protein [Spirochaetota bacterium]